MAECSPRNSAPLTAPTTGAATSAATSAAGVAAASSAAWRSRPSLGLGAARRELVRPSPLPAARIPPERRLSLPLQRRQVLLAGAKVVPYAAEGKEWHGLGCGHGAAPRSWPDRRQQRYARIRWTVHRLCSIRAMKPPDTSNLVGARNWIVGPELRLQAWVCLGEAGVWSCDRWI